MTPSQAIPKPRAGADRSAGQAARERLVAALPVTERRLRAAGIPTVVLEGGDGPPLLLLHGPGENVTKWMTVLPHLAAEHRVVAPDLPGHGASEAGDAPLTAERVVAWLDELVEQTCSTPVVLVGHLVGGAIAARFAARQGQRLRQLVLVDALGLAPFQPVPEFGRVLQTYLGGPSRESYDALWRLCAFDVDRLTARLGERWDTFTTYSLDRVRSAGVQAAMHALMGELGMPPIEPEVLQRITVPTTLIWGRQDLATPLEVAEAASERYGWPLRVIDRSGDDPAFERPEAFLLELRAALEQP